MNKRDRLSMVSSGHIRSRYGGNWETPFHASLSIAYILAAIWLDSWLMALVAATSVVTAVSRIWVGRVRKLGPGSELEIQRVKEYLASEGFSIKSSGKYYVEAFRVPSGFFPRPHVTVFSQDNTVYGSAWKYAGRGFSYVPFYTGRDELVEIQKVAVNAGAA